MKLNPLTLGGYRRCRCYCPVRYTIVNRSRRICCRKDKGLVVKKTMDPVHVRVRNMSMGWVLVWILLSCKKKHGPVCMRERGAWAQGGSSCECYYNVRCTIWNRSRRICLLRIVIHSHNGKSELKTCLTPLSVLLLFKPQSKPQK